MGFTFFFHPEISGLSRGPNFLLGMFLGVQKISQKRLLPAFWLNATRHFAGVKHPRSMAPSDAVATSRAGVLLSLLPVPEKLGFEQRFFPQKTTPRNNSVVLKNLPNESSPMEFLFPRFLGWLVSSVGAEFG